MDILDLTTEIKRRKVPAGTVLILQGEKHKVLSMLHSGLAEVLSCEEDAHGRTPEEILEGSIRVGLIKGESIFGILGIRHDGPYDTSIRAVSDCIVSTIPVRQEEIMPILQSKFSLNLQALRALTQRIESAVFLFNNYKYLWHKLASIADSVALAGDHQVRLEHVESLQRETADLAEYSAYLRQQAGAKDLSVPELWDHNVFLGRTQQELSLYEDKDRRTVETLFDHQQFLFFKRLIHKPDDILVALFKNDEPLNFYIFQFLSNDLEIMLAQNVQLVAEINHLIDLLFLEGGWIERTFGVQAAETRQISVFNHYLGKFCWRCRQDTRKLLGIDLLRKYPVYSSLKQHQDLALDAEPAKKEQPAPADGKNRLAKYRNLFQRILEFSDLDQEFKTSFAENMQRFKTADGRLENSPEMKTLRSELAEQYWKLYETCFLKIIDTDLKGFVPGIMLHFGLIDETLVTRQELASIDEAYARNLYTDDGVPVMTLPYFLEKIYKSELNPSITEMGESFRETIKRQSKLTNARKSSVYMYEDKAEDRVRFELRKIASENFKLIYGSKQKAVPFLCSDSFVGSAERLFLDPELFAAKVKELRARDFSVFYREVVLRHKFGTDFVRKEVVPNFVLYPVVGTRPMMWQELDGTKKDTPGRVFFPLFFIGSLDEAIPTVFSQFRWELQKIIAGVKWTDPIEGELVGSYYDYVNFYKKNPKLTPEAKAKLREFIQKTRSDRDRFTADYLVWLNYEYEGRLRMNPVVREIFYRYCPFPAEVRREMAKKPLFGDLEMKYQNRVRKEVLRMETRKKRFEKADEPVPEDILNYLEFLEA